MDKRTLLTLIAAILETLHEMKDSPLGGSPESYIWLGLQKIVPDLVTFQAIIAQMRSADLITVKSHLVAITPKGSELVAKLEKAKKEKSNVG